MADSKKPSVKPRKQVGALPYRLTEAGAWEFYLVTSRETRRWVIPKGWPMKGRSASAAAAQEAFEEAGLRGQTARKAIGHYLYGKRMPSGRAVPCMVEVFPMAVEDQVRKWPEMHQREGRWFSLEEAAEAVDEPGLSEIMLGFSANKAVAA